MKVLNEDISSPEGYLHFKNQRTGFLVKYMVN